MIIFQVSLKYILSNLNVRILLIANSKDYVLNTIKIRPYVWFYPFR